MNAGLDIKAGAPVHGLAIRSGVIARFPCPFIKNRCQVFQLHRLNGVGHRNITVTIEILDQCWCNGHFDASSAFVAPPHEATLWAGGCEVRMISGDCNALAYTLSRHA
jgi:hypothetical protein